MTGRTAGTAGLAGVAAVGICAVVAPILGHPAGMLLPAGIGILVALIVLGPSIGRNAFRHHRLSRQLRVMARPATLAGVEVRELDGVDGAFVAGLWEPSIFCAPELRTSLDPDELRAVVLHECHHQRDRAPAKLVVLEALAPLVGRIPAGRTWLAHRIAALEIAADGYAIEQGCSRSALARALLKLQPLPAAGLGIGFATATELRLMALLEQRPEGPMQGSVGWLLLPIIIVALCGVLLFSA